MVLVLGDEGAAETGQELRGLYVAATVLPEVELSAGDEAALLARERLTQLVLLQVAIYRLFGYGFRELGCVAFVIHAGCSVSFHLATI